MPLGYPLADRVATVHSATLCRLLADTNTPKVNSISYGWQGDMAQLGCQAASWGEVDANFGKLAAMGISIIFASGDSGSGQTGAKLWPSWPASSAWVTSVGGKSFALLWGLFDSKPVWAGVWFGL
jgi:subtilase family serine protease